MLRRLIFCALVALSFSSARADGYTSTQHADIMDALRTFNNHMNSVQLYLTSIEDDLGYIYENYNVPALETLQGIIDFLSTEVQYGVDAAISLADTVSSNLPQVSEDVSGILSNINQLITDLQTMLETVSEMNGAAGSCATLLYQLTGDVSDLNQEHTQVHIAERMDAIYSFFISVNDQFEAIANNTLSLVYQMGDVLQFYDDWDKYFYQQFVDASVPYTSLSWYSLDDAPWLNSNRYRPKQNITTFGSNLPRNFFKDLADILVSDARISSDIANSILFICSQLANTNQFAHNEDEFRSQLDDVVSSANEDKSILDNMSFDFNLQTPTQFNQLNRIRQISKYSVNSIPSEDIIVGGFQDFGNQISHIQGNMHLTQYSSFFIAVRNFFAFLYWGIFILFLWKLFTLVFRFFAFFKFQGVNQSSGLFLHTANGGIV